jgi:uncharacterized protein
MKFTVCLTQRCNLRCSYCYVGKREATMSPDIARCVVDWIFHWPSDGEVVEIGLFGGEPLLELPTVKRLVDLIESHPAFQSDRVAISLVSNGTIFSDKIARFLTEHGVRYCLSFDGPPQVQDRFRRFADGSPSSSLVEQNARAAMAAFGNVPVNAVYRPETFRHLPTVVNYLSEVGFRQIYLNPDLSARWTKADADDLPTTYAEVARAYVRYYMRGDPHFISFIDGKITVLLRGGYQPIERCRMGVGEFAFTPDGGIYPCERLIGCGTDPAHRLGDVFSGLTARACPGATDAGSQEECRNCGLSDYCMHWCGCSNFFSTGAYERVGAFLCASERAAIVAAARVFGELQYTAGPSFVAHLAGSPSLARTGRY